jgi:hypothetical protein
MSNLDQARETQLNNILNKTGKTLAEIVALIAESGLNKHGEIRAMLMEKLSLGHGDANSITHFALQSDGTSAAEAKGATTDQVLDEIYTGKKEPLRPIHNRLMEAIEAFGEFEIAPKKGYVSLRRKKQFAMLGPATNTTVEVGLNMKGVEGTDRLAAQPAGGMCNYKVRLTDPNEVDTELVAWIRQAYDSAG